MRLIKNKLLVTVIVLSICLRFVGLMPNILHSDEGYIQDISWGVVKNVFTKGDFNPHSFKYGTWSFYFQALASFPVLGISYLAETANTYLSSSFASKPLIFSLFFDEAVRKYSNILILFGRAETAIFGVASIFIIYLIGTKLFSKRVGLISALFLAVSPLHVRDSHYITTDIPFVFFVLVAFLFAVRVCQNRKLKDFMWLGFFTGFASTIRFFPLTLIFYGLTLLLTFNKDWDWVQKTALSLVFVILGFFIGLPYLFLDPNGFTLMMQDMQKYILPWYSTLISSYIFSLISSVVSHGRSSLPDINMLYQTPTFFRPVHAGWIFFNAYGILPAIFSILGILVVFFKSFKKFLLLFLTPAFTYIYISAYIPATYERLSLPIIPFLALFTAIFFDYLLSKSGKKKKKLYFLYVALIMLSIAQPFWIASRASIACSQKSLHYQSSDWVRDHISESAKIGYVTMVSTPPKTYAKWFALEPGYNLSLEEALKNGLDHAFINAGRLDYITYPFFNGFIIPPKNLYLNSYESLVLSEYQTRAKLLGTVKKPWMCDSSRIYYYELPTKLPEQKRVIKNINFTKKEDVNFFEVLSFDRTGSYSLSWDDKVGKFTNGSLIYSQKGFNYSSPRIIIKPQFVNPGKVYTLSLWVKSRDGSNLNLIKLVARMDFYDVKQITISGKIRKIIEFIKEKAMLITEGPTPLYFENNRITQKYFDDTNLPGRKVALSRTAKLNANWQKITVTARVPENSTLGVFSLQPTTTTETEFFVDDISIYSE